MMESWGWLFFAVVASISQAGLALVNEKFKVSPVHMLFWMRVILLIVLFPVALFITWPTDPLYYLFVAICAFIFAYSDLVRFGVVAKAGAGTVTRLDPLTVGITFVIWTVLSPSLLSSYMDYPVRAGCIVLSLVGSIYFALRLRRCVISRDALHQMTPVLVLGAFGIVIGKFAMMHATLVSGVIGYVFLQCVIVVVSYVVMMNVPYLARRLPHRDMLSGIRKKVVLLAGGWMAGAWLMHTPFKWMAITVVENPAYVTMVGLTAPLWVILFYKMTGRKEKSDVWPGIGIIVCVAVLVMVTQF